MKGVLWVIAGVMAAFVAVIAVSPDCHKHLRGKSWVCLR